MKIRFVLARPKSETPTAIMCRVLHNGKQKKFSTKLSIHPKLWDSKKHEPISDNSYYIEKLSSKGNHRTLIRQFDAFKSYCHSYVESKEAAQEALTYDDLLEYLNTKYEPFTATLAAKTEVIVPEGYISEFWEWLIEGMNTGNVLHNHRKKGTVPYEKATIQVYKNTLAVWNEFESLQSMRHTFNDLDKNTITELKQFLFRVKHYMPSSEGKFLKTLKAVFNHANNLSNKLYYHNNKTLNGLSIVLPQTDNIVLSDQEIEKLFSVDLSEVPYMEKYRDLFLIGCFTALRESDFGNLSASDFVYEAGVLVIKKVVKKTDDVIIIPVDYRIIPILEKYNYVLPKSISNQKINLFIKEICRLANISETVTLKRINPDTRKKEEITRPKYEWVTSHTARRTCLTNLAIIGLAIPLLMLFSGHKTEKDLRNYLKLDTKHLIDAWKKLNQGQSQMHLKAV